MFTSAVHALVFALVDLLFAVMGAVILLCFYGLAWIFGAPWILTLGAVYRILHTGGLL